MILDGKSILITGGTGSLGRTLLRRLLTNEMGKPGKIMIFSRDEAKQHYLRLAYKHRAVATDEIIYHNFDQLVEFRIGDVRNYHRIASAVKDAHIIFNAAALKQVPSCEYFPYEAVQTNVGGPENIIRVIRENKCPVETVVGISTDKACKPVNVMGMTKALQERLLLCANISCPQTRFVCVRYGNVLASRGSVIPLFHEQIRVGGPVTITSNDMTRFLLSLDDAVNVVFAAVREARRGETYIPRVPSARVLDVARVLIGDRPIRIELVGVRPGEKVHEILISEEECHRTLVRGKHFAIQSILPELRGQAQGTALSSEYSSGDDTMPFDQLAEFLGNHRVLVQEPEEADELLR